MLTGELITISDDERESLVKQSVGPKPLGPKHIKGFFDRRQLANKMLTGELITFFDDEREPLVN